ncbi:AraC family transcriptional regulator [Aquirhabdus parva]|uniref:AraC family transcriptional regulator n=2 Tax=Aquirhabdus parva TaxID=2283318 RepID=A0A345PBQ1_9GAMM|nr:AraC family transcriptional regulator [Aquirhabdus parva]
MGIKLLIDLASSHDMSVTDCLAETGIEPDWLSNPQSVITAHQEIRLIRNLIRSIPVEALGLDAGERYHLTIYGVFGFALTSSPSLRNVIELSIRYMDLTYAFCRMRLEDVGDCVRLQLDDQGIPEDVRRFIVERHTAVLMTLQHELLGRRMPLKRITLRLPEPQDVSRYLETFGVIPEFGADANLLEMDALWMDAPLPQANPHTQEICEAQCRELLSKRSIHEGVAALVRERLLHKVMTLPDMEEMATDLAMTSRTLRRKLTIEGTSYRELVDEVREALADELLAIRGMRVGDIAMRLGYAETSSFIHAFKRWKGRPPRGKDIA